MRELGADLVVIGNGAPHFIAGFRENTGYRGPLYVDPSLAAYRAANLKRGLLRTLNPSVAVKAVGAWRRGARQGGFEGDLAQQGGVLVILPSGEVPYWHVSAIAGDNAPAEEVVAALERAVGAA